MKFEKKQAFRQKLPPSSVAMGLPHILCLPSCCSVRCIPWKCLSVAAAPRPHNSSLSPPCIPGFPRPLVPPALQHPLQGTEASLPTAPLQPHRGISIPLRPQGGASAPFLTPGSGPSAQQSGFCPPCSAGPVLPRSPPCGIRGRFLSSPYSTV